jgi:hypothetical protein
MKISREDEGREGPTCRREKRTGGRDEIGGGVAGLFSTERGGIDLVRILGRIKGLIPRINGDDCIIYSICGQVLKL